MPLHPVAFYTALQRVPEDAVPWPGRAGCPRAISSPPCAAVGGERRVLSDYKKCLSERMQREKKALDTQLISHQTDYDETPEVLIVGGGIVGLSSSLFLSWRGI